MSAGNAPRGQWLVGILGVAGFAAVIGVLLTLTVAPAVALSSVGTQSAIGVFDNIPDYFDLENQPERNEIYAHSSKGDVLIATVYDQNREEVPYDQISPNVLNAAVAGEDKRFYDHGGVDLPGVIRAAFQNVTAGGIQSGASSITQQLVKQTFVSQCLEKDTTDEQNACYQDAIAQSFDRKIKEMKYAIALEKRYTKDEILTAYLNIANFGSATYGIEAAAQRYFGVHASELSVAQAASLIAIVQEPESRNPIIMSDKDTEAKHFSNNQTRRDYIIGAMAEQGYITADQAAEAKAIPVDEDFVKNGTTPQQGCRTADIYARWVCDYVVKSVKDFDFLGATPDERAANWKQGGYKIVTTVDLDMQKVAQDLLWKWTPADFSAFPLGSSVSVVEPGTGRIRVMVENKIFDDAPVADQAEPTKSSAVNFNTTINYGQSHGFQPGSLYKMFTLIDWLQTGHGTEDVISANEGTIPKSSWTDTCNGSGDTTKVVNDQHESGNYTVRRGTWKSVNGVFLRMATKLDLCDIAKVAASMGVERADGTPLQTNPTSVIGTNEVAMQTMAEAYATTAALGKHCDTIIVDSYVDPDGASHPGQAQNCSQVIDQDVAATTVDVMKGTGIYGTGIAANPHDGTPIFMKTGTTDANQNRLVGGGTTTNAVIVWTGNISGHNNLRNYSVDGVRLYSVRDRIFKGVMSALDKTYGGDDWPKPSGKHVNGQGTPVPDVTNQNYSYDQAAAVLQALGFTVKDGGEVDSDQLKDTIAKQDPAGNTKTGLGGTVTLYRSKQNQSVLPNVVGLGYANAMSTLAAKGWPASSVQLHYVCDSGTVMTANPSPQDGDTVTAQSPDGNSTQVTGDPVTLTIDLGGSAPNCIGAPTSDPTGFPGGGNGGSNGNGNGGQ